MRFFAAALIFLSGCLCSRAVEEEPEPTVVIQATPALTPFAKEAVRLLRDNGFAPKLKDPAGNTQVIAELGTGATDIAFLTRPLKVEEKVDYPNRHFAEYTLATHAVAVVVSRTVWGSGVHALKRDQIIGLYENKIRSWKNVGGEDRPAQFFEPVHEVGPWEIFATWLYGDTRKAPGVEWQPVADGHDVQNALQFASGGASVAALRWIDRRDVFPLAIIGDDGKLIEPTEANIAAGIYPLARPVIIVFPEEPAARRKKLLEFLQGEKGQALLIKHDFIPQSKLKTP